MKKLVLIIISVLFFFFFLNINSAISDECEPCDDNCTWQSPYNPPYSYGPENERHIVSGVTYGNSTCYFEVRFKMSECYCPNLKRELFIESIEFFSGGDCDNIPKEMIISRAIQQLLYESSVIFDISNPGTPFDIVIKVPSCLKKSSTRIYLDDCNDECCETTYTLQLTNEQGQPPNSVVILDKTTNDPGANCPGLIESQCQNICETNDVPLGPLFPDYNFSCPSGDPCETNWDTRPKVQSFTIGNCTFAAYFYTRDNCYDYNLQRYLKEIKIQKVVLVTPGCSPLPSNATILNTAWKKILREPERWFSLDPQGYVLIHNRMYTCWININNRLLLPCNQYACCWCSHWIRRTGTYPEYEYRAMKEKPGDIPAPEPPSNNEYCENGCSDYCSSANIGNNVLLSRINSYLEESNISFNEEYFIVNPNPAENILKISMNLGIKNEIDITISDILGNKKYFMQFNREKGLNEIIINLEEFNPGTYYYFIKYINNERLNKVGKFIIIK